MTRCGIHFLKAAKRLDLMGGRYTDADVSNISKLKRLEVLSLSRTNISQRGLRRLRNALPNCDVQLYR